MKERLWPFRGKWRRHWREDPIEMALFSFLALLGVILAANLVGVIVMAVMEMSSGPGI